MLYSSCLQIPVQTEKIQAIGFTVLDLDRSMLFYTQALGFEVMSDPTIRQTSSPISSESNRVRTATLRLGDEQIRLSQYLDRPGKPIPEDSQSNDLWFQHLAIVVRDMDRAYNHLQDFPIEPISPAPQTIPPGNEAAAYIRAFKFRDPDRHPLELIWFPPDKGQQKWHQAGEQLFLGIDHTAIAISSTETCLQFYHELLGLQVDGGSYNWRETQARMDGLADAKVRITSLRPQQGGLGIELLDYIKPANGRPIPANLQPWDIAHVQVELLVQVSDRQCQSTYALKDPVGHSLLLMPQQA